MNNRVLRQSVAILLVCMVLFTAAGCTTTETRYGPDGSLVTETSIDTGKTSVLIHSVVLITLMLKLLVFPY